VRDVERANLHAIRTSHVQSEPAPTEAGLDHRLTCTKLQLPADMIELGDLRLIERGVRRGVVRARVGHRASEPQLIEIVADVVVMVNVLAGAIQRVSPLLLRAAQK
jgi:hypothetical protein